MSKRGHISLEIQLAAALLQIPGCPVSYEESKALTAKQVRARFHLDHHPIPVAEGGKDVPWNLTWLPKPDHEAKTRKVDVPTIAKGKRIRRKHQRHQERLSSLWMAPAKQLTLKQAKRKWPSRPFSSRKKP